MKINKLIIIGFFVFLTVTKLIGQSNLVEITSKSKEGYQDLVLNIVDRELKNELKSEFWIITAKAQYKGTTVGFKLKFKNGLKPGLVDEVIDNTSWAKEAVEISTLGEESDNFVRIVSELYGLKTDKAFTAKPLVFTCFSLNSVWAFLDQGYYKFKLFFDDTNKSGIYTEIFINMNLPEGFIEIPDRNPQHREGFIKALIR